MEKIKSFVQNNKDFVIIGIFVALIIFLICNFNMFAQDEYNYSNITWTSQRLTSIRDVVKSAIMLWKNWSRKDSRTCWRTIIIISWNRLL